MAFQYQTYDNSRSVSTIGELMMRAGEIQAQQAQEQAALRARMLQQQGANRASAISGVGQAASGTIGDVLAYKAQAPQRQMQALQLQHVQQQIADEQAQAGFRTAEAGRITKQTEDATKKQARETAEDQQLAELFQTGTPTPQDAFRIAGMRGLQQLKAYREGSLPDKGVILPRGGTLVDPNTGDVRATGAPEPAPAITAAQNDERYRQITATATQGQPVPPADQAWAQAYEKEKTLTTDTSASASANRQATAIGAQTAQQGRAQTFAEQQAGRKELNDKVETPFLTAQASANTLRDVVAAAKAGNKVAGSLQSLEATMSAIRAQGLNRINTAEIGVTADAGSMWDRLVGWYGKASAGQPVPANIQQDMLSFADILEKAAAAKYKAGFDATTKRYKLTDEKSLLGNAPPVAPPPAKAPPPPGIQRLGSRP